jgi:hypothetical protein
MVARRSSTQLEEVTGKDSTYMGGAWAAAYKGVPEEEEVS